MSSLKPPSPANAGSLNNDASRFKNITDAIAKSTLKGDQSKCNTRVEVVRVTDTRRSNPDVNKEFARIADNGIIMATINSVFLRFNLFKIVIGIGNPRADKRLQKGKCYANIVCGVYTNLGTFMYFDKNRTPPLDFLFPSVMRMLGRSFSKGIVTIAISVTYDTKVVSAKTVPNNARGLGFNIKCNNFVHFSKVDWYGPLQLALTKPAVAQSLLARRGKPSEARTRSGLRGSADHVRYARTVNPAILNVKINARSPIDNFIMPSEIALHEFVGVVHNPTRGPLATIVSGFMHVVTSQDARIDQKGLFHTLFGIPESVTEEYRSMGNRLLDLIDDEAKSAAFAHELAG
ncbi:hypothetical protein DL771_008748 [Monosporascus sp. 5C6A]|nr:hypothetical protein DL771_008748 [Monosporascus sp. 5C6A]